MSLFRGIRGRRIDKATLGTRDIVIRFIQKEYVEKNMRHFIREIDNHIGTAEIVLKTDSELANSFEGILSEFAKITFKLECVKMCLAFGKLSRSNEDIKLLGEYLKDVAEDMIKLGSEK